MKKPSAALNTGNLLKIGQAAKLLGISIDTLRRWEKAGKLAAIKTPCGTRYYSQATLKQLDPSFGQEQTKQKRAPRVPKPVFDLTADKIKTDLPTLQSSDTLVSSDLSDSSDTSTHQRTETPKKLLTLSSDAVKIGQAAKILGVSVDTLRRWEKSGKITAIKTPGGTRYYSLKDLHAINPKLNTSTPIFDLASQPEPKTTEELLREIEEGNQELARIQTSVIPSASEGSSTSRRKIATLPSVARNDTLFLFKTLFRHLLPITVMGFAIPALMTALLVGAYLSSPKLTQQVLSNKIASSLLNPFDNLAQETVSLINPKLAMENNLTTEDRDKLAVLKSSPPPPHTIYDIPYTNPSVLAATASSAFLEINTDTQVNGSIWVANSVNDLKIDATPSANTLALTSGDTTLTVTKDTLLDQDVSTTASPTFASPTFSSLNLSANQNQLILQSGGPTGTITWTPTAQRVITMPDATGTVVLLDNAQTLTNKTMSGSSNTFSNIPVAALASSKITVTAGTNLTGGGDITLGGSGTIALKDSLVLPGTLDVSGATTLTGTLKTSGATTLSSTLAVTGATTLSSTLDVAGNFAVNTNKFFVDATSGNVGISTITPTEALDVTGRVHISQTSAPVTTTDKLYNVAGNLTWNGVNLSGGGALPSGSLTGQTLYWNTGAWNVSNTLFNNNTNVGIGTISPQYKLDVAGTGYFSGFVGIGSSLNVSGNVGVGGTATLSSLLLANSSAAVTGSLCLNGECKTTWTGSGNYTASNGITLSGVDFQLGGTLSRATGIDINSQNFGFLGGSVGIGKSNPSYQLETTGNVGVGGSLTVTSGTTLNSFLTVSGASSLQALTATSINASTLTTTGNVGVGGSITGFGALSGLNVTGLTNLSSLNATDINSSTLNTTGNIGIGGTATFSNPAIFNGITNTGLLSSTNFLAGNGSASLPSYSFSNLPNAGLWTNGDGLLLTTGGTNTKGITVTGAGNIGIGITNPTNKLEVLSGNIKLSTDYSLKWTTYSIAEQSGANTLSFQASGNTKIVMNSNGNLGIGTASPLALFQVNSTGSNPFVVTSGGNVGIGTTNVGTSALAVMLGNVGIGTTSPLYKLDVIGQINGSTGLCIAGDCKTSWSGSGNYTASNGITLSGVDFQLGGTLTRATGIDINSQNFGFLGGNVGIGKSNPSYQLETTGNVGVGGSLTVTSGTTLNSFLTVSGASSLQALTATSINASTLTTTGNVGVGGSITGFGALSGLNVTGLTNLGTLNAGAITSTSLSTGAITASSLTTTGNVGIGGTATLSSLLLANSSAAVTGSLCLNGECKTTWSGSGNYTASNGITLSGVDFQLGGTLTRATGIDINSQNFGFLGGSVGIGKSNPSYQLETTGNVGIGGSLTVTGLGVLNGGLTTTSIQATSLTTSGNVGVGGSITGFGALSGLNVTGLTNLAGLNATTINASTLNTTGNIGIGGTATISSLLLANSSAAVTGNLCLNGECKTSWSGSGNYTASNGITLSTLDFQLGGKLTRATGIDINSQNFGFLGGNVGIGTSAPTAALQVTGGALIGYTPSTGAGIGSGNLAVSGNVGIGTTTPGYKLHVYGGDIGQTATGDTPVQMYFQAGGVAQPWRFIFPSSVNGGDLGAGANNFGIYNSTAGEYLMMMGTNKSITFGSGAIWSQGNLAVTGSSASYFSSGNVGIGTALPTAALQVNSTGSNPFVVTSGGNVGIGTTNVGTSALAVMLGNVGIGTTSPNYKLDVIGQVNGSTGLCIGGDCKTSWSGSGNYTASNGITLSGVDFQLGGTLTRATGIDINSQNFGFLGGSVGIGKSNPSYQLETTGNVGIGGSLTVTGLGVLNGGLTTTSIQASSLTTTGNVGVGGSITGFGALNGLNVTGLTNLASLNATTINASSLTTTGNVGVGGSITGFGALNGLNVTGLTNLAGLNATDINSSTLNTTGNIGIGGTATLSSLLLANSSAAVTGNLCLNGECKTSWSGSGNYTASNGITLSTLDFQLGGSLNRATGIDINSQNFGFLGGSVGIGKSNPSYQLETTGNVGIGGSLTVTGLGVLNGGLTTTSIQATSLTTSGNVGVGGSITGFGALSGLNVTGLTNLSSLNATDINSSTLNTTGNIGIGGTATLSSLLLANSSAAVTGNLCLNGECKTSWSGSGNYTASNGITLSGVDFQLGGTLTRATGIDINSQNFGFLGGNVGIGKSNPSYQLETTGNAGIGGSLTVTGLGVLNGGLSTDGIQASSLTTSGNVGVGGSITGFGALNGLNVTGLTNLAGLNASGNVGIGGTATFSSLLLANSSAAVTGNLCLNGECKTSWSGSGNYTASNGITLSGVDFQLGGTLNRATGIDINSQNFGFLGGNVGIGLTNPSNPLTVGDPGSIGTSLDSISQAFITQGTKTYALSVYETGIAVGTQATLAFGSQQGGGNAVPYAAISSSVLDSTAGAAGGALVFKTRKSGTLTEQARIDNNGNLGIGFTSPNALLHIGGANNTTAPYGIQMGSDITLYRSAANTLKTDNNLVVGGTITSSGTQFLAGNGSASAPAFSFTSTPTIGMWTQNSALMLTTAGTGTSGLTINSAGNVGIGTTLPLTDLEISSPTGASKEIRIDFNAASTTGTLGFSIFDIDYGKLYLDRNSNFYLSQRNNNGVIGMGTNSRLTDLTIANSGNIGINNVTVPGANLHINGNAMIGYASGATPASLANGLAVSGNVGIGTTNPGTGLAVSGAGTFGYGGASSFAVSNGTSLAVSGNLGVGTTSPLANLHVVGQCVAEGTRIRRRRRGKNGKWIEEDIPVEDIEPGDEVLSLNDKTGKWEWHKVEKTMDMGIQEVRALTTSSAKRISTTGNHPYLVINKPLITHETFEVDQSIRMEDLGRPTFIGIASVISRKTLTAKISREVKNQIHKVYQKRNKPDLFGPEAFAYAIVETLTTQQIIPSRLVIDTEYTGYNATIGTVIKRFLPETELIFKQIGKHSLAHEAGYQAFAGRKEVDLVLEAATKAKEKGPWHKAFRVLSQRTGYRRFNHPRDLVLTASYYSERDLSRAKWVKVSQIKVGQYIATADGWEKVAGIQGIGRIQTYDLQIESTHNFVGNNIVAHNTYINNGLNIGAAFTASGVSVPSNGLAVQGNVGIGTTSPSYQLETTGNVGVGGSLTVTGLGVLNGGLSTAGIQASSLTTSGNVGVGGSITGFGALSGLNVTGLTNLSSLNATDINSSTLNTTGNIGIGGTATFSNPAIFNGITNTGLLSSTNFLAGNGSASLPSYSFSNLPNAGLWTNGDGLLLTTGGTDTKGITVTGAGNVGIGITSPVNKLDVNGGVAIGSYAGVNAAPSNGLIVSGTVAIGANSPGSSALYVAGGEIYSTTSVTAASSIKAPLFQPNDNNVTLTLQSRNFSTAAKNGIEMSTGTWSNTSNFSAAVAIKPIYGQSGTAANTDLLINRTENSLGSGLQYLIDAQAGGVSKFNVTNTGQGYFAGNLGIGTASPLSKLGVAGNVGIGVSFAPAVIDINGLAVQGNVGIGTTTTSHNLEVIGTANISGNLTVGGSFTPSGVLLAPDGTASAPSYSFSADTDSGLWRVNTNLIALTANGSAALQSGTTINGLSVNSTGNVGIGTTNPGGALVVASGNVGIGFTSPDRTLQIATDISPTISVAGIIGATNGSQFSITGNTAANLQKKLALGIDTTNNFAYLQAGNADGTAYNLALQPAGGNVGIGTTNPNNLFQVANLINFDNANSNSFVGYQAGKSNTTGANKTAFGYQALYSDNTTTGTDPTAFGYQALYSMSTGGVSPVRNSAFGYQALYSDISGDSNSAFGWKALNSVTGQDNTGYDSSAFGASALQSMITGINNNAFGFGAMQSGTSGDNNSAFGNYTLQSTTGSANSAFGREAMNSNSTGSNNAAFGMWAGRFSSSGSQNVFIGREAGHGSTGYSGADNNVMIGYQAGYSITNNQDGNVFLGYMAGYNETGSNKLYIANSSTNPPLIYGDFSTGNIGIGTITPSAQLHLQNTNTSTGLHMFVGSSAGQFGILDNGNVGIGTSNPGGALVVASGNVGIGFTSPDRTLQLAYDINITPTVASLLGPIGATSGTQFSITGNSGTGTQKKLTLGIDTTDNYGLLQAGNADGTAYNLAMQPAGGNVGIGTTSPIANLEVYKNQNNTTFAQITNPNTGSSAYATLALKADTAQYNFNVASSGNATLANKFFIYDQTAGQTRFVLDSSGNVGIGNASPTGTLVVNNGANAYSPLIVQDNGAAIFTIADGGNITWTGATLTASSLSTLTTSASLAMSSTTSLTLGGASTVIGGTTANNTLTIQGNSAPSGNTTTNANLIFKVGNSGSTTAMTILNNGNVGINTSTPKAKLSFGAAQGDTILLYDDGSPDDNAGFGVSSFGDLQIFAGASSNSDIIFGSHGTGTTINEKMRIKSTGNVGIGITNPAAQLHIQDSLSSTGLHFFVGSSAGQFGILDNGNVGIGTSAPTAALQVTGGALIGYTPSTGTGAPSLGLAVSGSVGIGKTNPVVALDVVGSIRASGSSSVFGAQNWIGTGGVFQVYSNNTTQVTLATFASEGSTRAGLQIVHTGSDGAYGLTNTIALASEYLGDTGSYRDLGFVTGGSPRMVIKAGGNVGIGFTSPNALLHIGGANQTTAAYGIQMGGDITLYRSASNTLKTDNNFTVGGILTMPTPFTLGSTSVTTTGTQLNYLNAATNTTGTTSTSLVFSGSPTIATPTFSTSATVPLVIGSTSANGTLTFEGNNTTGNTATNANLIFKVGDSGATTAMTILNNGNLGIGTITPAAQLHIQDSLSSTGLHFFVGSSAGQFGILDNGNVGIGTTNPETKFQIGDGTSQDQWAQMNGKDSTGAALKLIYGTFGTSTANNYTYIGSLTNHPFTFRVNNAEKMRIDTSGNLGIGTISPAAQLHLQDTLSSTGLHLFVGSGGGQFSILDNGNVGIGTTTPTAAFDVQSAGSSLFTIDPSIITANIPANFAAAGDVTMSYDLNMTNPTASYIKSAAPLYFQAGESFGSSDLTLRTFNSGSIIFDSGNVGIGQTQAWTLQTAVNSLNIASGLMSFDTTNNRIGIGTTSPAATLEVSSGTVAPWSRLNPGDATFTVSSSKSLKENFNLVSGTDILDKISNVPVYTFDFINGSKDVMGLLAEDFTNVFNRGSDNAINYQEVIMANWLGTQQLYQKTQDQQVQLASQSAQLSGLTNLNLVTVNSSGNVGIGTSNPEAALDVKASGTGIIARFNSDNSTGCTLSDNGTISCTSDKNLKKNIQDLNYGLGSLMQLNPVSFNWKSQSDNNTKNLGFIAQDVESVVSGLVTVDPKTGYKQLNSMGLIPILVKSVQEQQIEISNVKAQMSNFKIDSSGNIGMGTLKLDKLVLNASEASSSALTSNGTSITYTDKNNAISTVLTTTSTDYLDLANQSTINELKTTTLEERIKSLEEKMAQMNTAQATVVSGVESIAGVATNSAAIARQTATPGSELDSRLRGNDNTATSSASITTLSEPEASRSATPSAKITTPVATSSAQIATPSASVIPSASEESFDSAQDKSSTSSGKIATSSATPRNDSTLNLTPPSVLLATQSSQVLNLNVASDATISGKLTAYEAIIQETFKALGPTFLGETTIAGNLTVNGTMHVTQDSLNVIGTMHIQNSLFAQKVDFFRGLVTVDNTGTVSMQKLALSSKTLGTATILAGQTEAIINADAITGKSKIFITPISPTGGQAPFVSYQEMALGFIVNLDHAVDKDVKFNWFIVDQSD